MQKSGRRLIGEQMPRGVVNNGLIARFKAPLQPKRARSVMETHGKQEKMQPVMTNDSRNSCCFKGGRSKSASVQEKFPMLSSRPPACSRDASSSTKPVCLSPFSLSPPVSVRLDPPVCALMLIRLFRSNAPNGDK